VVAAEVRQGAITPISGTNLSLSHGTDAVIYRLNAGPLDQTTSTRGFRLRQVTQRNVRVPAGGGPIELDNQFILDDVFSSSQKTAWRDVGGGAEDPVGIMSKKVTDALALIMKRVPIGLRLDRIGRDHHDTSVRAAAVSATQLIVQRAALELDLNPEEFEALEPRIRGGQPTLQIADFLVNVAGFCRRLTESDASGEIMVHQLIASMLDGPSDPLVGDFLSDLHRSSCTQACYRCIQRYGNRNYHGLLDWRLGLGFLRALSVNDYRSGLDGDFSVPELIGWREHIAKRCCQEIMLLRPDISETAVAGPLSLPFVRMRVGSDVMNYLMVHPFWRINKQTAVAEPFLSTIRALGVGNMYFVALLSG
jgi:hypothetical protein